MLAVLWFGLTIYMTYLSCPWYLSVLVTPFSYQLYTCNIMARQLRNVWHQLRHAFTRRTQECPALYRLPIEIILEIVSNLPISSAASFALTSRTIRHILGQHILEELKAEVKELHIFLSLLEKDLPKHFHCHDCESLHRVFGNEGPRNTFDYVSQAWQKGNQERLKCFARVSAPERDLVLLGDYKVFQEDMYLAMKRHHYGRPHGISLKNFQDVHLRSSSVDKFQARIISDELYIHREIWAKISPAELEKRFTYPIKLCCHLYNDLYLCNDIRDWDARPHRAYGTDQFLQHVLCTLSHPAKEDCMICSGLKQCPACFTEYTITKQGENTVAILAWYNFGTGRHSDEKWRSHMTADGNHPWKWEPVSYSQGSIYDAWNQSEGSARKAK